MDLFNYVFTLIGLLLGLSLVEVLSGLVRLRRARTTIRIGWLTPLLGILVILHVTSFWGVTWSLRELLPTTIWPTLGAGVVLSGAYYLAASGVFPAHLEGREELDDHYWRHKREVLGIVLIIGLAVQASALLLGRELTPLSVGINVPIFIGLTVACVAGNRSLNIAAMGVVIAMLTLNFLIP